MALSRAILQGLLILKEKLQLPVMKLMVIMAGSEEGGEGSGAEIRLLLQMRLGCQFGSLVTHLSAVQVKVILNGMNLCNRSTNGNSLNF